MSSCECRRHHTVNHLLITEQLRILLKFLNSLLSYSNKKYRNLHKNIVIENKLTLKYNSGAHQKLIRQKWGYSIFVAISTFIAYYLCIFTIKAILLLMIFNWEMYRFHKFFLLFILVFIVSNSVSPISYTPQEQIIMSHKK